MLRQGAARLRSAVAGQCTTRGLASGGGSSDAPPSNYTYLPPGCSMREPVYISLSEPVYFYDTPPSQLAAGKQHTGSTEERAPQGAKPAAGKGAGGLRAAFEAVSGEQSRLQAADKRPHSYKMVNELSQQPYVVSANHSMHDPKYISITEPKYNIEMTEQKQAPKQQQATKQQAPAKQQGAK